MIADIPEKSATTLRIYEQIERKANIFLLFRDAAVNRRTSERRRCLYLLPSEKEEKDAVLNAHVVGITKVYPNSKIFARFPIKS